MTEEIILNALKERNYTVPKVFLNEKIAKASIERSAYQIMSMPKEFLTPELCEIASKDFKGFIEYVPIEMRTENICKLAMENSTSNFPFIPVALRSTNFCTKAYSKNKDLLPFIPYELYFDVFEGNFEKLNKDIEAEELNYLTGIGYFYKNDFETAISFFEKAINNETTKPNAEYMMGWAYFKKGNLEKAQFYYEESQKNENVDYNAIYNEAFLMPVKPVATKLNQSKFNELIKDYEELSKNKKYEEAIKVLDEAEKLLEDAQYNEMHLWAYIWDYKRFVLYYIDEEKRLELCKEKIKILEKVNLWAYLAEHNPIRHTLRSMHHVLAYDVYDKATNYEALKVGLAHIEKALNTIAPIEDKEVLYPFYETQALLYHKAEQYEPLIYQKKFESAIEKIKKNKKLVKDYISEEFIEKYLQ